MQKAHSLRHGTFDSETTYSVTLTNLHITTDVLADFKYSKVSSWLIPELRVAGSFAMQWVIIQVLGIGFPSTMRISWQLKKPSLHFKFSQPIIKLAGNTCWPGGAVRDKFLNCIFYSKKFIHILLKDWIYTSQLIKA